MYENQIKCFFNRNNCHSDRSCTLIHPTTTYMFLIIHISLMQQVT